MTEDFGRGGGCIKMSFSMVDRYVRCRSAMRVTRMVHDSYQLKDGKKHLSGKISELIDSAVEESSSEAYLYKVRGQAFVLAYQAPQLNQFDPADRHQHCRPVIVPEAFKIARHGASWMQTISTRSSH